MVMCVPRRGECLYVCIWPRGAFVRPMFPRSHVRSYTLTAPHDVILTWRDSKQDSEVETPGSSSIR